MDYEENLDESLEKCMQFDTLDKDLEIKLEETEREKIGSKILEWLNENPIRSISSVDDFFQLLGSMLDIEIKKDGRMVLRSSSRSDQEMIANLKRNRDFFSSTINKSEKRLEEDYEREYKNETEELLLLRLINMDKQIIEGMKDVELAIGKFTLSRRRHRYTRRFVENLFDFMDSIILLILRWVEIEGNKGTYRERRSLELLEWDVNTFKSTHYNLKKIAQLVDTEKEEEEKTKHLAEAIVELLQ